jgi:Zn-dependent protease
VGWSLPIFRIAGIQLRIHVTFLLLIAWLAFSYYEQGGSAVAASRVLFILLLFACVVLHEFGHALAAKAFGINTPDITLLPIGGVARLERMPEKPMQELVIALAGPMVNVVIALGLFVAGGSQAFLNPSAVEGGGLIAQLLTINILLLLFNLLPAFPMDGGRVLRALLATRLSYARATQVAASIGQGFAFVFGFRADLEPIPDLHRVIRLYRGITRSGAGADERCIAPFSGLERDGARISHSSGKRNSTGSGGRSPCHLPARFSGR